VRAPNRLRERCQICGMRADLCVCQVIPKMETATRVVVILHHKELATTSNSGRLVPVALSRGEWRVRGGHYELDTKGLVEPGVRPLLLFPAPGALPLNAEFLKNYPGPHTLLVPDGTWSQAKKVARREPLLANALAVCLENPGSSIYKLRIAPRTGALATFEAIAAAMGILEGKHVEEAMMVLFTQFVQRCLDARQPPPGTPPLPPIRAPENKVD